MKTAQITIQHGIEWLTGDCSDFEYTTTSTITVEQLGWLLHDYPEVTDGDHRASAPVGFILYPIYREDSDVRPSGRSFISLAPGQSPRVGQLWRAVCNRYSFAK